MTARPPRPGADTRDASRRFLYGPVLSRRLGFSLGVDVIPFKTCSLDCVYCQLGPTERTSCRRRSFFPPRHILDQIRGALRSGERIDVITFSGSGEPTLNRDLGALIRGIKKMTPIPVAVLTNGTLLSRPDVRRDLQAADLVVPSLDAATPAMFRRVNRPHASLDFSRYLRGLAEFRREFKGRIWLEIMLVKGLNDSPTHIRALRKAAAALGPDRIHLNTVVRPPSEAGAAALSPDELERIRAGFGPGTEIASSPPGRRTPRRPTALDKAITAMTARRPVTVGDISIAIGRNRNEVLKSLTRLLESKKVRSVRHGGKTFYRSA
jgi:wyosine [tRNA(Phe)-imidazoG37] synthetase (radical SAM superfamily)